MRYCFIFIAFVSLLCSCKGTQPVDDADVLVKVKDRTLRRSEIKQQIPRGLSSADSMLLAESLERKWVKDALVYDVALRNLEGEDKAEVDKLVEEYRHSLIRYRYQEQLIKERLSSEFQESDMLSYYEENQKKFVLDKALVKGLFLKIPVDAPGLVDVKGWQHWGMGIGNPLLPGPIYNKNGQITFISNRVLAHHIGFCGSPCQSLSYRMLLSYSRHWGTYDNPLNEIKKQFNSLFEVTYAPQQLKGWSFTVSGAMDRGSLLGNNYGGMLVIRKQGIIKSGNK